MEIKLQFCKVLLSVRAGRLIFEHFAKAPISKSGHVILRRANFDPIIKEGVTTHSLQG